MNTYRNTCSTKRNSDCATIVACQSKVAPSKNWEAAPDSVLIGLSHLYTKNGVRYFGYP
jgi:hypothetical protein